MSDLHDGAISLASDTATGSLKYVTDYTGFSGDVSEQSGNYLALHFSSLDNIDRITVQVSQGEVELDEDGIIVIRVTDTTKSAVARAYKDNEMVRSISIAFSGLTLEEPPAPPAAKISFSLNTSDTAVTPVKEGETYDSLNPSLVFNEGPTITDGEGDIDKVVTGNIDVSYTDGKTLPGYGFFFDIDIDLDEDEQVMIALADGPDMTAEGTHSSPEHVYTTDQDGTYFVNAPDSPLQYESLYLDIMTFKIVEEQPSVTAQYCVDLNGVTDEDESDEP